MDANAIILTLAYPETIVSHAEEWYSKFLPYLGIGGKRHVRAGHAALVLIHKASGVLEYHDFGRYITPQPNGRVRGRDTDHELDFPLKAQLDDGVITNLDELLQFLATHPKLTHGDGTLYASVCDEVSYEQARTHIDAMQTKHFIKYAAFVKEACNCARFVTDALIAGVTNPDIRKKLIRSKWFTPSTIGNVVLADTQQKVYQVSDTGAIRLFTSSVHKENRRLFLDRLKGYQPSLVGTLEAKHHDAKEAHAQWLPGIAAGAWFELYDVNHERDYRFRRISPHGHIDVDGIYQIDNTRFDLKEDYKFVPYSNCKFFHIEQNGTVYRFDYLKPFTVVN
ncbi:hypothetical protein OE09_0589 [Flavobacteriaceae bacterium MAR_2010_72]|nr:hypothetical protein OE09_0589 [Flavobacteriaceae bacterium MAR_2010_72]